MVRVRFQVPGSALPGEHAVSARGQRSGRVAQATFLVRTDWEEFHKNDARTGYNPFENVLTPQNVSGLAKRWTFTAGADVDSSPAVVGDRVRGLHRPQRVRPGRRHRDPAVELRHAG